MNSPGFREASELEKTSLRIHPKLVALSGMDGSGKDEILRRTLSGIDTTNIRVVEIGKFEQGNPAQRRVAAKISARGDSDLRYAIGYEQGWREVKNLLDQGCVVVVKRPFNYLVHAIIHTGSDSARVEYLKRRIASGKTTGGLWPNVWVEVQATTEDIAINLGQKAETETLTSNDPQDRRDNQVCSCREVCIEIR